MKTITKRFMVYLSAVLVLLAASASYAMPGFRGSQYEGKEGKKEEVYEKKFQDMTEKLDLSEKQKEQLKAHRDQQKTRMKELKGELKTNYKELRKELENYDTDERTIKGTAAKLKTVQAQLLDQKVDNFLAMKKILAPEQFQKMNELRKERHEKMRKKMKSRRKNPGKCF
jgi:Spy/CpxP family protein refolding chaperone